MFDLVLQSGFLLELKRFMSKADVLLHSAGKLVNRRT